MNLMEIGEFAFIENLRKKYQPNDLDILKGIGDDTAVFLKENDTALLLTTDMFIENIHFRISDISPEDLGFKSLSVNLSDIAAMGGIPKNVFVSLAIPEKISYEFINNFYRGMDELIKQFNLSLIGGDTNFSRNDFVINIVITGVAKKDEILYRDGAKVKDKILVTGYLGDSSCGLDVCNGKLKFNSNYEKYFRNALIRPKPQINEGKIIAESKIANSMIDLSDGIASDLRHICLQSGVGAVIFENLIPYSDFMKDISRSKNVSALDYALYGGEDYCLLVTVSPECKNELYDVFSSKINTPLFEIGEIVKGDNIEIVLNSGERKVISKMGFQHF